jgi:ubiquinone/menaquinone biosynthesis C-methylase UbiE
MAGPGDTTDPLLEEQTQYYIARGANSDDWFYRRGRYDHGSVHNRSWFREAVELVQALSTFNATGNVLEIAGGTGLWTQHLVMTAERVTVVDVSPESLAANRTRLGSFATRVRYVEHSVFDWNPREKYDAIFFAFFLSHVPPGRFDAFWDLLRSSLAPGGRVFLTDTLRSPNALHLDYRLPDRDAIWTTRRFGGREYRIYKSYQSTHVIKERLEEIGWQAQMSETHEYFMYGTAQPH